MGEVLNLDSYRKGTERMWLTAYGFDAPTHWNVVDGTIGKNVEFQGLRARTTLIGRRPGVGVCVLTMVDGNQSSASAAANRITAVLNAGVVARTMTISETTWARIWYADGHAYNLAVSATDEQRLMSAALYQRSLFDCRVLSTAEIAPHLVSMHAARIVEQPVSGEESDWIK